MKTPLIYDKSVWETSGHWEKFRENMFLVAGEGEEPHAGLKPMNCPGHMLLFGSALRSYRDLPIRYAESSTLHRNELAGALHGLLRVRHVTQDDAHIFCTEEQVAGEIDACIEFVKDLYAIFGVTPHAELSTRPEERLGTDEEWDHAEGILRDALERHGLEYVVGEGEGTFYAPKIDLHMRDTLGRSWQMGTIQADAQMPRRFGLTYMGPDNVEHVPVVIHRALLGSLERFIGIIVEHYGGVFPFWLAPVQARLIPVGEDHRERRAASCAPGSRRRASAPTSTSATRRSGKRIRDAELEKIPFTIVYGDRESDESLAVRERGGEQLTASLSELLERFRAELATIERLKEGADHCPSPSRATRPRGFNRAGWTRKTWPLLAAVFVVDEEDSTSLVKSL